MHLLEKTIRGSIYKSKPKDDNSFINVVIWEYLQKYEKNISFFIARHIIGELKKDIIEKWKYTEE